MKGADIQKYLPKYLSAESQKELFDDVKKFVDDDDTYKVYTTLLDGKSTIYQGDGLAGFKFYYFEKGEVKTSPGLVLSNTCDISLENDRYLPTQILYSPIVSLSKYIDLLQKNGMFEDRINSHIDSVRRQEITSIFYIPEFQGRIEESVVFLDRISNMRNSAEVTSELLKDRIFTLSNFGFYLLLLKISIHFTRIREGVDRRTA